MSQYCYCCHGRLYHAADCPERFGVDDDETELEETIMNIRDCTTHFHPTGAMAAEIRPCLITGNYSLSIRLKDEAFAPLAIHSRQLSDLFNLGAAIQDEVVRLGGGKLHEHVQAEHMLDADSYPIDYAELGTGD